ncbi:amino acid ABC transporter permease [Litoribrevibacter albus]|uniref:Amino acid ABC transporter permease n=1 Tax=Litoribrevibacter albus TaxID=1473156 RepID=A0AA37S948_9GAMM|nr:amino acid ABC transporter permease [Litoribrevibacter albus]GLQ30541.1 amino acid ABC transporter permease [Litoribrevibacter albus]
MKTPNQDPSGKIWNDPVFRGRVFQGVVLTALIAFFAFIVNNTLHNLEVRGISTGFAFLDQEAGFGIIQSLIEYNETHTYGRTFIVGILNTLLVSVLGIILATLLGFLIGIGRLSTNWLISRLAAIYIETFRNIPLLLQIFFWYFAVLGVMPHPKQSISWGEAIFLNVRGLYIPDPQFSDGIGFVIASIFITLIGIWFLKRWAHKRQEDTGQQFHTFYASIALLIAIPGITYLISGTTLTWDIPELRGFNFKGGTTILPEFTALLVALTIYTAAFIAENVRSGLQSVPKGQLEASRALGLKNSQMLRLVVIPQAMRVIIPPLTSQYLNLTKNSSLATAIGYPDLVSIFAGTTLNQSGQAIEIIFMVMAVYLTISLVISLIMNIYNKRMALVER